MDHTRDNPLKRFTAFWIALLMVFAFGIACVILRPLTHGDVATADEVAAEERLETKEEIDRAQSSALNTGALRDAIAAQATNHKTNVKTKGSMAVPGVAPTPAPSTEPAE